MTAADLKTSCYLAGALLLITSTRAGTPHESAASQFTLSQQVTRRDVSLINAIVGRGYRQEERLEAVRLLRGDLNLNAIAALCAFVQNSSDGDGSHLGELRLLKNNVMDVLIEQNVPSALVLDTLIESSRNTEQDEVIRDYCIQHLVASYNGLPGAIEGAKQKIWSALLEAAKANNSIAGTALLGLHRLSWRNPRCNQGELDEMVLQRGLSSTCDVSLRVTAIQICGERDLKAALPVVRALSNRSESLALQTAAIASLGRLGGHPDAVMLRKMTSEVGLELKRPIDVALRRLATKSELQ